MRSCFFIASLIFLCGCTRDKAVVLNSGYCFENQSSLLEPSQNNGFDTFPYPSNVFGEYWYVQPDSLTKGYAEPCFNPLNGNQICYRKSELNGSQFNLCILDLCTGLEQVIAQNCLANPRWGRGGWIVYHGPDLAIYKIKPNGDSMTLLQHDAIDPAWSYDATKIAFLNQYGSWSQGARIRVMDLQGNLVDSVDNSYLFRDPNLLAFSSDDKIAWSEGTNNSAQIAWLDLKTREYNSQAFPPYYVGGTLTSCTPFCIKWYSDNTNLLVSDVCRIYRFNTQTKEKTDIKVGADNRAYYMMDLSPDNKWIVEERADCKYLGNDSILAIGFGLFLMKADGSSESRIKLPWH